MRRLSTEASNHQLNAFGRVDFVDGDDVLDTWRDETSIAIRMNPDGRIVVLSIEYVKELLREAGEMGIES